MALPKHETEMVLSDSNKMALISDHHRGKCRKRDQSIDSRRRADEQTSQLHTATASH